VLLATLDLLGEDAVLIADAVAIGGQAQSGHRVEEARGQTAKAAVAQTGVLLQLLQLFNVQTQLIQQFQTKILTI